jgi:hypothetical protein
MTIDGDSRIARGISSTGSTSAMSSRTADSGAGEVAVSSI